MQGLGNKAILTGADGGEFTDGGEFVDPSQAELLLDVALELHGQNRRTIFFCSCASPNNSCHRHWVAPELFKYAKKREQPVTVVEWPGYESEPSALPTNQVSDAVFSALVKNTRSSIPLGYELPASLWLELPWWTPVMVECGTKLGWIFGGPAQHRAGGWQIPFLGGAADPKAGAREIAQCRKGFILLPRAWPSDRQSQSATAWEPERLPRRRGA
jgi:hypothetical protein